MNSPVEVPDPEQSFWRDLTGNRTALTIGAGVAVLAIVFVALSLQRPEPPTFAPSSPEPSPAGSDLVGPRIYTVDSRQPDRWQFFSFSRGGLVSDAGLSDWDLAFRRFQVIVNGGDGFTGKGGVISLSGASFDSLGLVPEEGYEGTAASRGDSIAAPLEDWYAYNFLSHLLSPAPSVYAVRTADGRYAKLRFLSYYCPGAQPGCVTFEYVYQGAGGREVISLEAP